MVLRRLNEICPFCGEPEATNKRGLLGCIQLVRDRRCIPRVLSGLASLLGWFDAREGTWLAYPPQRAVTHQRLKAGTQR